MQTEQPQLTRGNQMANNKHGWRFEPGTTENTAVGWSETRTKDRRQSYLAQDSGRYQALTQVKKKQGNTSWLPGICSHRKTVLLSVNIPPHLVTPPDKWSQKQKKVTLHHLWSWYWPHHQAHILVQSMTIKISRLLRSVCVQSCAKCGFYLLSWNMKSSTGIIKSLFVYLFDVVYVFIWYSGSWNSRVTSSFLW